MLVSSLKNVPPPYRIHVFSLLSRLGWKSLVFKNVCIGRVVCALS